MTNPFEDEDAQYVVLRNAELQCSLWPTFVDVPPGWDIVFGAASRPECIDFIENTWTDMRPKSLIDAMNND
jgi:MbtH protein